MNIWLGILLIVLAFIVGRQHGYLVAHRVVAAECKRLGKFFVGNEVFECTLIKVVEDDNTEQH